MVPCRSLFGYDRGRVWNLSGECRLRHNLRVGRIPHGESRLNHLTTDMKAWRRIMSLRQRLVIIMTVTIAVLIAANFSHTASAEIWDSDWGPVQVQVDNNNRFIAYYNNKQDGIIKMSPKGNGFYKGHWARTGTRCGCPRTRKTRSGHVTACYGSIKGYLVSETRFEGSWESCEGSRRKGGKWNGWMR